MMSPVVYAPFAAVEETLATAGTTSAVTVVVAVALLLPGVGSLVDDDTVAVFETTVPPAVARFTAATRVKIALPTGSEPMLHEIVPLPPTAGVVRAQPPPGGGETNVVPAGSVSERLTVAALLGPALLTVIV